MTQSSYILMLISLSLSFYIYIYIYISFYLYISTAFLCGVLQKPNVLIVGDSVSEGYTPFVMSALPDVNFGHGPDNTGGGAADGVGYGQLCMKYFVRTPQHELPPWVWPRFDRASIGSLEYSNIVLINTGSDNFQFRAS